MRNNVLWLILALIGSGGMHAQSVDWESHSLIDELSPEFSKEKVSGQQDEILIIETGARSNLHGYWQTTVSVEGGKFYEFSILKKVENIIEIGKATPINIFWRNNEGTPVLRDKDYAEKRFALETFEPNTDWPWRARPEIPYHAREMDDGTIRVSSVFQAPSDADYAVIQLHLRYYDNAMVEWSDFSLREISAPEKMKVKVASVFLPPTDIKVATSRKAAELFLPFIEQAAEKGVRLVCLPEWLTKTFTRLTAREVAELIPNGPSVRYFTELAKENNLYIVAGLVERDRDTLYNTAVLVGPDGFIGKYRKTGLTMAEANEIGLTPGHKYPVFETEIGRIGIMTCYDVYFPEVAQNLSKNGAQIIAMPIAGGNPVLAKARAIENQVYLITSTYSERKHWLKTAVFDYDGTMLASTDTPGTMAIAEIEISDLPKYWAHLGDLKADLRIQAPIIKK